MKKKSGGANDAPDALFAAVIAVTIAKQPWTGFLGWVKPCVTPLVGSAVALDLGSGNEHFITAA